MKLRDIPLAAWTRIASPLGEITLAATDAGLAGLWFEGQKDHPGDRFDAPDDPSQRWLAMTRDALRAYWRDASGARFDVPLDLHGTPFQRAVWHALLRIPAGATCSYGEIARRVGAPTAVRAVGAAVGRNPVSILVPCHRVIGHDGRLTGYAGGLPRKVDLLRREAAREATPA